MADWSVINVNPDMTPSRILLDVIVSLKQKDTTNILFYWEEYEMKFEIL
jgi:hypothetical protein